jgi:dTDP-4-amino-4,6-dideoxygalactose transaminase
MVDAESDFNISAEGIEKAITSKTKVIIPVDIGGFPCDYDKINSLVKKQEIKNKFSAANDAQKKLGRILVLADAAHSIGALYKGNRSGSLTDISVLSFHAVKNLTTAEGGAVCLNLPAPFNNEQLYLDFCIKALHGQTKDAFSKMQKGAWEYDVMEAGYKLNMPDVLAAIGFAQLAEYDVILKRRKAISEQYEKAFAKYSWAELPIIKNKDRESSYHLFALRIKDIDEPKRNKIIQKIFERDVAVNVHFKPLPLLSLYKGLSYRMSDYPAAYDNYSREISLPIYFDLTDEQVNTVINAVVRSVEEVI